MTIRGYSFSRACWLTGLGLLLHSQCLFSVEIERFEHLDSRHGLSQNNVLTMFCDHTGYMWFGTMDGLNRYDGYSFRIYKMEEGRVNALTHNRVSDIWEDSLQFLWIKTYEGYFHYFIPETEEFISFPNYYKSSEEKNSFIQCFHQPLKNEIWLGSSNSGVYLLRYDPGTHHYLSTQFLSRGPSSISNNTVNFVISDPFHNIWIGTNQGLNYLSKSESVKEQPYFQHHYASYRFTCAEVVNDFVFFGTQKNGILLYDIKNKRLIDDLPDLGTLKSADINFIQKTRHTHAIIIGTRGNGTFIYLPANNRLMNIRQYGLHTVSLFEDSYGMIWLKTERYGIVKINPSDGYTRHYTLTPKEIQSLVDDERPYIYEDRNRNLWIGTHGGGLAWYDQLNDEFTFYRNAPNSHYTISSNFVHCLTEDKSGLLWAGTVQFNGGINIVIMVNPSFKQIIPKPNRENLADNVMRCLFQDSNGYTWMATKSGTIYIYSPQLQLHAVLEKLTTSRSSIPGYIVYTMMEDDRGFLWMGTKGGGILVSNISIANRPDSYKRLHFNVYQNNPHDASSLSNNFVYSIIQDSHKKIWIGTYGGGINTVVSRTADKLTCRRITSENSTLSNNHVRYLFEDSRQRLWVATTFGLDLLENSNIQNDSLLFRTFLYDPQHVNSISYNDIIHIFEDSKNRIWFGTFGGGLNLLTHLSADSAGFTHFKQRDGLSNDAVFAILEDTQGYLWLSTENGISNLNPADMTCKNYNMNSGLYSENFCESTCWRLANGKLLFGSINGTLLIDPERISSTPYTPPLVLTNFQLFNRTVDFRDPDAPIQAHISTLDTIVLKYNQSSFSIEYAALSYFASYQNKYKFILKNFEDSWNEIGDQTKATYTNLSPGTYIFMVKAASWDGTWNENPRILHIIITPPWWKSTLARIIYVILFVIIYLISRRIFLNYYKLQNDLKVERRVSDIKLQFFTNISHEIRTPLTLILGPIEDIKSLKGLPAYLSERINIIERNGKRMLRLVNQLLEFRKVQKNKMKLNVEEIDLVSFVDEICEHFTPIARQKHIHFNFSHNNEKVSVYVDAKKFDSVVFNILSNAFKYTRERKSISVELKPPDEKYIDIVVTDQGSGIPKNKLDILFQRFTPLSANYGSLDGTGIGLNLSYEIMKLHKGQILVESEPGRGSAFTIRTRLGHEHFSNDDFKDPGNEVQINHITPIENADYNLEPAGVFSSGYTTKPKMLVVEDNIEIIIYIRNIFEAHFEIKTAKNGLEGIAKLEEFHPDIIITDVMMPECDGIEMTRRIKDNFDTSHIPVVMLTAKSAIEDQLIGIESGAEAYILKPFNSLYLNTVVKNLLKQRENIIKKYRDKSPVHLENIKITARDEEFMNNIVNIIESHYSNPEFNVEKMVEISSYSRTVFYNKLKGLTGLSPVDFLRQTRLKMASEILVKTGRGVSETAFMTGFNDVKYFSKCFKHMFGVTPAEYKKTETGKQVNGRQ
ncbi:MAG: response regulator [Bacteroidales bacterium]|nr:response regulator [Bacteroidales bacterium]